VFNKSNGHPLALIYLLRTISQQNDVTLIEDILEQYPSYKTNIDEVYQSHWNVIKNDPETSKFFGEISRLRKYIPLGWVIKAYGDKHFRILNQFMQYFRVELKERAYFFHANLLISSAFNYYYCCFDNYQFSYNNYSNSLHSNSTLIY